MRCSCFWADYFISTPTKMAGNSRRMMSFHPLFSSIYPKVFSWFSSSVWFRLYFLRLTVRLLLWPRLFVLIFLDLNEIRINRKKKKQNLEIGIVSPKNFVGSNINLGTSYHIKPTTVISIRIKSEWQLFRVPISNRMVEELRENLFDFIIIMLKNYGINLNVITSFFLTPTDKSLKKSENLASYQRLGFLGKKFEPNYINQIYLKFRITCIFFMFYYFQRLTWDRDGCVCVCVVCE